MPCINPINPYIARKGGVTFQESESLFGRTKTLPCGQCRGCRYMRTKEWAVRCYLEAQTAKCSAFLNLTYSPEHLPENGTLVKKDLQKFIKRLRRNLEYQNPDLKIRFYASGEYGDDNGRPHYHVLIFGYDFPDKYFFKKSRKFHKLYRSPFLEKCWTAGHSWIGDVQLESAAYVAGYIRKKINGEVAEEHYKGREPEFSLQSTVPGIGYDWYQQNKIWLWHDDAIRVNNRSYRPPRYFEKIYKEEDPAGYEKFVAEKKSKRTALYNPVPVTDLESETENGAKK